MFKSGFIAIVGNTNVGKSTLINALVQKKISITSSKAQTTRSPVIGICHDPVYQLIFIDTPGIINIKEKYLFNKRIKDMTLQSLRGTDIILFVVDRPYSNQDKNILKIIRKNDTKVILIINKIDLLKSKIAIDKIILSYMDKLFCHAVIPLSSVTIQNLDILKDNILACLKEGPLYYPKHIITNTTNQKFMSEIIREKILYYTHQEIPHACHVIIENISPRTDFSLMQVSALILTETINQKKILIGLKGRKLKKIGTEARKDINKILDIQIHLNLWIKVERNWRSKNDILKSYIT
ncbi:MAG: GTPase Era [Weeping tea tree witches'-broom phytoplasma]|uniref:GTPase Era n=1 Tax=Candidatus Phytoplasma melaleucae TaxID=2982630 RepID=UPI00293ADE0D|nr:GTPase Era [Weeping tea tree witches'-broom phytoplasma]